MTVGVYKTRRVRQKYCTPDGVATFLAGESNTAGAVYRANNIHDPFVGNFIPSNATPAIPALSQSNDAMLTDQFAAIYDQCVVHNATITCNFLSTHANPVTSFAHPGQDNIGAYTESHISTAHDPFIVGISVLDSSEGLSVPGHYCEVDNSVWCPISPQGTRTLQYSIDVGRFFGVPEKSVRADDELRITDVKSGATPTNELFFHCWAAPANPSPGSGPNQTSQIELWTYIEYDISWMEPKAATRST
jgi:hypothetical protein